MKGKEGYTRHDRMRPNLCHRDVCPYPCHYAPSARSFSKAWCAEEEDQTVSEEALPDPG
jgi:hypothetical protein